MSKEKLESIVNALIEAIVEPEIYIRILLSLVLLGIIIALSFWKKVNIERSMTVSFIRGFIQIILMGSVLIIVFSVKSLLILYLILIFMCFFASVTVAGRYKYPGIFKIELISILTGSLSVISIVIFSGIIPKPVSGEYVIPLGSMVIANTMIITMIVIERMYSSIKKSKGKIEAALSLGDTSGNALKSILKESYKAGLMPSINRLAVLGIVTIPGLMSGMIIGGVNPVIAAVYQVIIFLMILSSAFIASIIATKLCIKRIFTNLDQLNMNLLFILEKEENNNR